MAHRLNVAVAARRFAFWFKRFASKPWRLLNSLNERVGLAELILVSVLLIALGAKYQLMRDSALGLLLPAMIQHDALVFSAILALLVVRSMLSARVFGPRGRWQFVLRPAVGVAALAITVLYVTDVACYAFFGTRLYVSDIVTFSAEPAAALSLVSVASRKFVRLPIPLLVLAMVAGAVGAVILFRVSRTLILTESTRGHTALALASVGLAAVHLVPTPEYIYMYGDKPLYENFVRRNANFFSTKEFSDAFRHTLADSAATLQACVDRKSAHEGQALNIVIVIVESLSSYHSRYFSGLRDWTPRLDEIARSETALPNFFANGWTSIGGLLSLLGGTFPFVPEQTAFNQWGSPRLTDFMEVDRPYIRQLVRAGYDTLFVGGGDLRFLGQAKWLTTIGFQQVIGHNDWRFGEQKVRGPFEAVPDRVLFEVAADEIMRPGRAKPLFAVIQTFWSHRPFLSPSGAAVNSEEVVIREADTQIGVFYDTLKKTGFLSTGLLFITGDHRAMEPFSKAEFDRFGPSAVARIPAVVATKAFQLPPIIEQNFQQVDLGASISAAVMGQRCHSRFEGTFLDSTPTPPRCIFHARGVDRDLVFVKCGKEEATVRIAGDQTRVESGNLVDANSVVLAINRARMRRTLSR